MPRIIGTRCGVKTRLTGVALAAPRPWTISGWWRWPLTLYALKLSDASAKSRPISSLRPAPDTPGLAVGDEMRRVDDPRLEQRQEAELHRGRVAAGIADDARRR